MRDAESPDPVIVLARLGRKTIDIEEALGLSLKIEEDLESAYKRAIVHRNLNACLLKDLSYARDFIFQHAGIGH